MKLDRKTMTLLVSVALNLLGGLGLVDPLVPQAPPAPCEGAK
jgi:hypothetical protein